MLIQNDSGIFALVSTALCDKKQSGLEAWTSARLVPQ